MPLMPASIISNSPVLPTGLVVLYDNILQADAANWDVQNISGGYKHLKVIIQARGTAVATSTALQLIINGDNSGSHYEIQDIYAGTTASASGSRSVNQDTAISLEMPCANATAGYAGSYQIDINNYASTTFHKNILTLYGSPEVDGGLNYVGIESSVWQNTSAITSLRFTPASGNLLTGSRITIYGMGGNVAASSSVTADDANLIVAMEVFA